HTLSTLRRTSLARRGCARGNRRPPANPASSAPARRGPCSRRRRPRPRVAPRRSRRESAAANRATTRAAARSLHQLLVVLLHPLLVLLRRRLLHRVEELLAELRGPTRRLRVGDLDAVVADAVRFLALALAGKGILEPLDDLLQRLLRLGRAAQALAHTGGIPREARIALGDLILHSQTPLHRLDRALGPFRQIERFIEVVGVQRTGKIGGAALRHVERVLEAEVLGDPGVDLG